MTRNAVHTVVLGIGNSDRGDDGAGPAVIARLRGTLADTIACDAIGGEATALLSRLDGASCAFLIDACTSGALPGTVQRFDVHDSPLPHAAFGLSTHGFGLAEAIELGRSLQQLPSRCIVYAIEAATFEPGVSLSHAVAQAVANVADRIRAEILGKPCTQD